MRIKLMNESEEKINASEDFYTYNVEGKLVKE